jgi:uncharacterized membrane protein
MATIAGRFPLKERRPDLLSGTPRAHAIDRWIFVLMAAWYILIVLVGFIPDSIMKVQLVQAGQRAPFPLVLHLHAIVMGSFLLLLFAQSILMATGRCEQHKKLGIAAFVLVPLLVVVGFVLAPTIYHQVSDAAQSGPPALRPQMQQTLLALDDILLLQIRAGVLFPLFMAIGLMARAQNAGLHKRMIFLAPVVPLGAAVFRMTWLPTTFPVSALSNDLFLLFTIAPLFIWDVVRNRRVHEAYWIWLAVTVPVTLVLYSLWNTPWWHSAAPRIMGV